MASRYWGMNRGQHDTDIVEGSSTGTKSIELVVDLAANMTRDEVLRALIMLQMRILKGIWPPA